MKQQALAMAADQGEGFEQFRRPTKRDAFLAKMQETGLPKAGNGRPPIGLERMLRMYFVQRWFNLADEACEEALLDRHGAVALRGHRPRTSTREGWLYVAAVMDLYSWRIVGWPISDTIQAKMVSDALLRAIWRRRTASSLIHPRTDFEGGRTPDHVAR